MVNDNAKNTRNDNAMRKERYSERREQRRQQRQKRRVERIEKAELALKEETRADIVQQAKHILIEEKLAERIDKTEESLNRMKQELRDLQKEHREKVRKIRTELGVRRPVSTEERARRRERAKQHLEHREKTLELINEIEREHRDPNEEELYEILPPKEALMASKMSYIELAKLLNEREHPTFYNKEWTRLSIQKFVEQHSKKLQEIGHVKNTLQIANAKRSAAVRDFAKKMRDEVLPSIDTNQPYLTIADELNTRGIKTRTGGEWGNVSVKRLLDKIEEL